eukprot:8296912-Lingulodinium_polyedra.AAC.1
MRAAQSHAGPWRSATANAPTADRATGRCQRVRAPASIVWCPTRRTGVSRHGAARGASCSVVCD